MGTVPPGKTKNPKRSFSEEAVKQVVLGVITCKIDEKLLCGILAAWALEGLEYDIFGKIDTYTICSGIDGGACPKLRYNGRVSYVLCIAGGTREGR